MVYQIGDLLDLWRETDGLNPDLDVASAIEDDHESLLGAFYDSDLRWLRHYGFQSLEVPSMVAGLQR